MTWSNLPKNIECKIIPEPNSGCWLWLGYLNPAGYGNVGYCGKVHLTHRITFKILRKDIPQGLNVRRSDAGKTNSNKTRCKYGHEFSSQNTRVRTDRRGRQCKQCQAEYMKQYRQKESRQKYLKEWHERNRTHLAEYHRLYHIKRREAAL